VIIRSTAALDAIRRQALRCTLCDLSRTRSQVVFGDGNPDARLIVVGEAPGAHEDKSGKPFQGAAGRTLDALLAEIGLDRSGVFITNVVMCRPPGNRRPRRVEVDACAAYLDAQLELVAPLVVLALGAAPTRRLLGRGATVAGSRGRSHEIMGLRIVSTYHPSPLSLNRVPERRAQIRSDFRLVSRLLAGF
jgi:uracil-DNA glycosylase family 4